MKTCNYLLNFSNLLNEYLSFHYYLYLLLNHFQYLIFSKEQILKLFITTIIILLFIMMQFYVLATIF